MSELLLDRYEVVAEAGSGGFASVVVAYDTRIRRLVAIKCLPLDSVADNHTLPEQGSILTDESEYDITAIPGLDEARTAALLNNPHIVQVYDFEVQNATAYLILEYIDGMSLGDMLKYYNQEIDADIIAAVFDGVSRALKAAHAKGVLHLDIKPDNVLIDQQGQVKVVDFGLARLAGDAGYGSAAGGTIGYMPPEQMRQEDLDERCDEWALASLTYELIAGANPFLAPTLEKAEDVIYDAELVLPSLCREGFDESIDDIMFCALDPDREERYDSVSDFAREMKQCLGSPKKGVKKLAELVGNVLDEEDDDTTAPVAAVYEPHELSDRAYGAIMRVSSALFVALTAFLALSNIEALTEWSLPVTVGLGVLMVALGAVIPHLGALVSLEALGIMFFANEAPLPGVLMVVEAFVWWYGMARRDRLLSNAGMSIMVFGGLGLGFLAPLMAGFVLRVKDALITSAHTLFIALMMAGMGSGTILGWDIVRHLEVRMWTTLSDTIVETVTNPCTWCLALAWLISALVIALLCSRGNKVFGFIGVGCSLALMICAYVGGLVLQEHLAQVAFAIDGFALLSLISSAVIVAALIGAGIPERTYDMPNEEY